MVTAPTSGNGMNLFLAVMDHAITEAEDLEAAARDLETKADEMRHRAKGLREIHAVASPYFPAKG